MKFEPKRTRVRLLRRCPECGEPVGRGAVEPRDSERLRRLLHIGLLLLPIGLGLLVLIYWHLVREQQVVVQRCESCGWSRSRVPGGSGL